MTTGDHSPSRASDARARQRLGVGAVVVLVVAALAVTVGIGILRSATAPVDEVAVDSTPAASATPTSSALFVHVSGAVSAAGLYVLPSGSRVVDAVAAAEGFSADADRDAVNLARQLTDGEQLVLPRLGEVLPGPQPGAPGAAPATQGRIDLNTADASLLDTLPRIGPALAERIVTWRQDNGGFTSVDDLLAVPGIGDKMFEALRDLVTV